MTGICGWFLAFLFFLGAEGVWYPCGLLLEQRLPLFWLLWEDR